MVLTWSFRSPRTRVVRSVCTNRDSSATHVALVRNRFLIVVLFIVLALVIAYALKREPAAVPALTPGTRLMAVGDVERDDLVTDAAVATALAGTDPESLFNAMRDAEIDGLVVRPAQRTGDSLAARLQRLQHVPPLRGASLTPSETVYMRDDQLRLRTADQVLGRAARLLLGGVTPPPESAFPPELTRSGSVEVMVLLRDDGQARLWRSARGMSISSALILACRAARERWREREGALGGPLAERLPWLDVEVSILREDGTIQDPEESFVERAFTEGHGVAYEDQGRWRYLLPEATARSGQGSAVRAYRKLFADNALPPDSLERVDLRFYRVVLRELSRSAAPSRTPAMPAGEIDLSPIP